MHHELICLAEDLGRELLAGGGVLTTAESCTGGLISAAVTAVPGSSRWFAMSWVVYANEAKSRLLDVDPMLLEQMGAVSREVVAAMLRGALKYAQADLALAVSGIAGPEGGTQQKPVGTVWIGAMRRDQVEIITLNRFEGDRQAVRHQTVAMALQQGRACWAVAEV
ncbi:MAG: CinA family protein [Pseudomonadales bacterium]|nr:CinA family protein [Pseudomonadales bacterium]